MNLYTNEEIGDGYVYVPGGVAILGGDPDAIEPLPRQEVDGRATSPSPASP